ncbi:MAG TPA: VOC family protein [Gammaproteobacteria bacterium]|nr:VOC family protein [Gammaproteobacteria bacterium]
MARKKVGKKSSSAKRKSIKSKPRAKARKVAPIPKGYHSVTPYLSVRGAAAAIEFYKKAFGAKEKVRMPDGERIAHAEIVVDGSHIMLADEYPERGFSAPQPGSKSPVGIMLYLKDVDTVAARAVEAGAILERPVEDQFYGDRLGGIIDPFGHRWYIATHKEDVSAKEMQRRMQALGQPQ